jgi:hypothetical protein
LSCEYLREFSKKFETVLTGYSGVGGKLIHKTTRSKKSRDTVPLNGLHIRKITFTHGNPDADALFPIQFYILYNRVLQCLKLNENQTENDKYWQKLTFSFCNMFENAHFFAFAFKVCKKGYYNPNFFSREKY